MGRLFQYNRFGSADNKPKKDNVPQLSDGTKDEPTPHALKCPAYSAVYPSYHQATTSSTAAPFTSTTPPASRSIEVAIKKYHQWSSRFLPAVNPSSTTTTTVTAGAAPPTLAGKESGFDFDPAFFEASISHSRDSAVLLNPIKQRPKVYDCMRDFLRRKLFQQPNVNAKHQQDDDSTEYDEDITSDYDEVDMLDASYHADEEDATDCSCPSEEEAYTTSSHKRLHSTATQKPSLSSQKSMLSLNCWQHTASYSDSTLSSEDDQPAQLDDDSDAGISDCCQLIADKSPKRLKLPIKPKSRFNINNNALPELLEASWYQPRITTKAALQRLQHAAPGSFLVRRKARTFELCLRTATKVKQYAVIATGEEHYKLKGAKKQFSSLKALVTHHSVMAEQLPLTLTLPREAQCTPSSLRYADDFDTFESLQILGILKNLQAKNFELS